MYNSFKTHIVATDKYSYVSKWNTLKYMELESINDVLK